MYTLTAYDIHSFLARNVLKSKKDVLDLCEITVSTKGKHVHTAPYSREQCQLPLLSSTDSAKTCYNSNFINLLDF